MNSIDTTPFLDLLKQREITTLPILDGLEDDLRVRCWPSSARKPPDKEQMP